MLEISLQKTLGNFRLRAEFSCDTTGVIAFFGRSGAGKSTLINLIAGLARPDTGSVTLQGTPLYDGKRNIDLRPEARRFGYVFQEGRLFPHLSVRGNLLYGFKRAPREDRRITLDQVVSLLGLELLLDRRPRDLSGGEKQRVAIGRALLANPKMLLMDEPLAALDHRRKDEILVFVERLRDELEIPIIYVSHSMEEIVRLADTLVLMSEGEVVAVGAVDEVMSRLDLRPMTGRYEAGAVLHATIASHERSHGLTALKFSGGTLRIPLLDMPLGADLRVRIRARDVALALEPPRDTSFSNILPCRIADLGTEEGPQIDLRLDAGGSPIWARVTARSLKQLDLRPGKEVYALVKGVAIDRHSLGRVAGTKRFAPDSE